MLCLEALLAEEVLGGVGRGEGCAGRMHAAHAQGADRLTEKLRSERHAAVSVRKLQRQKLARLQIDRHAPDGAVSQDRVPAAGRSLRIAQVKIPAVAAAPPPFLPRKGRKRLRDVRGVVEIHDPPAAVFVFQKRHGGVVAIRRGRAAGQHAQRPSQHARVRKDRRRTARVFARNIVQRAQKARRHGRVALRAVDVPAHGVFGKRGKILRVIFLQPAERHILPHARRHLAQPRVRVQRQRLCQPDCLGGLARAEQVARVAGVHLFALKAPAQALDLPLAVFRYQRIILPVEAAVVIALRLRVAHKKNSCFHAHSTVT